jgi:anti-sigma factor RsiW
MNDAAVHADHIGCSDVVELVTSYVEDALDDSELTLFEQHLNFCDGCITYVDQMRKTITLAGRLPAEEIPPETRERLVSAFRGWRRS